MAWGARPGLKLALRAVDGVDGRRLNGLGSPSGIETVMRRFGEGEEFLWLNGLGSPSGIETVSCTRHLVCVVVG